MALEFLGLTIVMASMVSILIVSYGRQQEKYNKRRNKHDSSRHND